MFDTMVFTKALGALCGALLIFLLGQWVATSLYVPGSRNLPPAFVVDTGVDPDDPDVAEADVPEDLPLGDAFEVADAGAGARVWNQCRACHVADDTRNSVGPYLQNVVGRQIGAVDGFRYSGALPEDERWTVENLYAYLENPRGWAPGTSMAFNGLRNQMDRVNVIAFLIDNSPEFDPAEIPAPSAVDEAAVEEEAVEEEAVAEATEEEAIEEEAVEEAVTEEAVEEEAVDVAVAEEAIEEEAVEEAVTEEAVEEEAVDVAVAEEAIEEEAVEEAVTEEAVEEMSAFAQMVADGDVRAGQRVWNQCRACHVADAPTSRVGPHLVDIVGRPANSVEGFRYSGRLPDVVWTLDELNEYLENPRGYAPGTSMAFNGLRNEADRANVLAYIISLGD